MNSYPQNLTGDEIDPLYRRIIEAMVSRLHEPWLYAKLEVIFHSSSIDFEAEYLRSNGELTSFIIDSDGKDAVEELRHLFGKNAKRWGQFRLDLKPDGTFEVKFGFEKCDENGNTMMSEDEWLERRRQSRLRHGLSG